MKNNSKQAGLLALTTLLSPLSIGSGKGNTTSEFSPSLSPLVLSIQVDPDTKQVTLRWTSKLEASYAIEESTNLQNGWARNFLDIEGNGNETSFTFTPTQGPDLPSSRFFRVLETRPSIVEAQNGTDETDSRQVSKSSEQIESNSPQEQSLESSYSAYKNLRATESSTPNGSEIEKIQFHIDPKLLVG